ncbi:phosphohistidino protein-hexose phosphotransferase component of PTS system [Helicostylum pulchrum]|nr:phosphohistidino protein-hexose phosphotransferase component of PTS system [Helicostylum pulchrum]
MLSQEVAIETPNGFKAARNLKSDITLTCNGKTADSKSPSNLMALSLSNGDVVTISVSGAEEEKNLQIMVELMKKLGGQ